MYVVIQRKDVVASGGVASVPSGRGVSPLAPGERLDYCATRAFGRPLVWLGFLSGLGKLAPDFSNPSLPQPKRRLGGMFTLDSIQVPCQGRCSLLRNHLTSIPPLRFLVFLLCFVCFCGGSAVLVFLLCFVCFCGGSAWLVRPSFGLRGVPTEFRRTLLCLARP